MIQKKGTIASPGVAIGPALVLVDQFTNGGDVAQVVCHGPHQAEIFLILVRVDHDHRVEPCLRCPPLREQCFDVHAEFGGCRIGYSVQVAMTSALAR